MRKLLSHVLAVSAPLCTLLPPAPHGPCPADHGLNGRRGPRLQLVRLPAEVGAAAAERPKYEAHDARDALPGGLGRADRVKGTWYRVSLQDRSESGLKSGTAGWAAKTGLKPQVCMQLD